MEFFQEELFLLISTYGFLHNALFVCHDWRIFEIYSLLAIEQGKCGKQWT
jgi:hypothetical protein